MPEISETWRLVSCARCRKQLRLCPRCDRGQRFCSDGCADLARRERQRAASARYQASRRGRRLHAASQGRYRDRCATDQLVAQKVTDGSVTQRSSGAISRSSPETHSASGGAVEEAVPHAIVTSVGSSLSCSCCGVSMPMGARFAFARRARIRTLRARRARIPRLPRGG